MNKLSITLLVGSLVIAGCTSIHVPSVLPHQWPLSEYDLQRNSSISSQIISPSANRQAEPAIYGDRVAWSEQINGYWQVVVYETTTKTRLQITTGALDHVYPSLNNNSVIWWEGEAGGPSKVAGFDFVNSSYVSLSTGNSTRPKAGANAVVWVEYMSDGSKLSNIRYFAFPDQGMSVVEHSIDPNWPAVSGSFIVWSAIDNGHEQIRGYNLTKSSAFTVSPCNCDQTTPDIDGTIVVWQDDRQTGSPTGNDIYGYDLIRNSEFLVSARGGNEVGPRVSANFVVWTDYVGSNVDVYAYNLAQKKLLTVAANEKANSAPAIYNSTVVWSQAPTIDRDAITQIAIGELP